MTMTREQIEKLATLSRVQLDQESIDEVTRNVSRIVEFFDALNDVDTRGVDAMSHPLDMTQRLRSDAVTEEDRRDKYQASAPHVEGGLYLVPKVID